MSVRQDQTHLYYRARCPATGQGPWTPSSSASSKGSDPGADPDEHEHKHEPDNDTTELVKEYFNLEPQLAMLYEQWSTADANFKKKAPDFAGIRVLHQDPWETLVGFICSSNNNIARISQMVGSAPARSRRGIVTDGVTAWQVEKLCAHYGPLVGRIGDRAYHDVPAPAALTGPKVESHLRELGFGYRAKYLHQTAVVVANDRPGGWLDGLKNPKRGAVSEWPRAASDWAKEGREGYRHAHGEIVKLSGVGPKVADCICLMGLGWGEAVPVDTHVWQIAQRDYKFGRGKHRTLTRATYDAVAEHFRSLWGDEAGWAHSVLFAADLRAFSARLRPALKTEEGPEAQLEESAAGAAVIHDVEPKPEEASGPPTPVSSTGRGKKRKMESVTATDVTAETTAGIAIEPSSSVRALRTRRKRAR